jgi:polyhydroxyalkanoate synthase
VTVHRRGDLEELFGRLLIESGRADAIVPKTLDFIGHSRAAASLLRLGDWVIDLRNIPMPVLNIYAEGDVIIPTACSKDLRDRFSTADYTELGVPGGHIGTFVGGKAQKILAPAIVDWLRRRM